jgi:SpoVK/Ycf46/Vps4 family AAA+-type ATPase
MAVVVRMAHILSALSTVTPSVSEREVKYYEDLHAKFQH